MRFGTKIVIAFVAMLALTFGAGGSLLIATSTNNAISQAQEAAVSSHRLILYTLSAAGSVPQGAAAQQGRDYDDLLSTLAQLDAQGGQGWLSLRLSDEESIVYLSNGPEKFDNSLFQSADEEHFAMLTFRSSDGGYLIQIAGRFEFGSSVMYLESMYDLTPVFAVRQYQQTIYRRLFVAVLALGAVFSWLLSFWMTSPLRRLSRVTRTIASGDLSCRASISNKDEIGVLAADFNNMADRLQSNINELMDAMRRQEEFMGGLAHELKTPMTSIIGYADLLRGHHLSDDDRQDAANYIFMEGRRLEVLSLKLLDLIVLKKRDFEFVPTSIARLVASAAQLLKPILSKNGIRLSYDCDSGTCMVEPDLVTSLLLNLIDNARKAIDGSGEIFIQTRTDSDGCTLRIADNGKGIPEEELYKIKDAFYRVDKSRSRAQGGVGLGLRLCEEIVTLHGGEITFESELGRGTAVTVRLIGGAENAEQI